LLYILAFIDLQHGEKGFLWDFHAADFFIRFLPSFGFSSSLRCARYRRLAFGGDVFAHRLDGFAASTLLPMAAWIGTSKAGAG